MWHFAAAGPALTAALEERTCSCLTIKRKPAPGTPGAKPSPADIAREKGKADEEVKDEDAPVTENVDATGKKQPTKAGLLKRVK